MSTTAVATQNIQPQEPPKTFTTIDAYTLLQQKFDPLQFAVDEILPHGLFILAGSSKIGKSWLSLDICRAVATGDEVWRFGAAQGEVLYLALEDNYRRLYNRLRKIGLVGFEEKSTCSEKDLTITPSPPAEGKITGLSGFHMTTAAYGINSGLIEQVHNFIANHPKVRLLVVDTLERIRDTIMDKSIYSCDYRDMMTLREITDKYNLTMLLIHHTRKMNDDDPINMLSGSTGLTGSVDGIFVLQKEKRISNKAMLTIANRDTDEFCFDLEFNRENCMWLFKGNHDENENKPKATKEDMQASKNEWLCLLVDDFLGDSWTGTATELATALNEIDGSNDSGITHLNIKRQLQENSLLLKKSGIVIGEERTDSRRLIKLSRHD